MKARYLNSKSAISYPRVPLLGKGVLRWLPWGAMLIQFSCAATQAGKNPQVKNALSGLQQQIELILQDSSLYQSRTGIKIVSLGSGEVLYQRDSKLLFHPASNMKLLTTAAALAKLGPNFTFMSTIHAASLSLPDSTIFGNLYFKGFADPGLTTEDLWWMVQKLKGIGVRKITGDLVCDESYLDDLYFGSGWMWDDVSSWYWPHISALTVNRNCVKIHVEPGPNVGDILKVHLEPATTYMKIENHSATVDSSDTTSIEAFSVKRKWREGLNIVVVDGGLAPGSQPKAYFVEVVEPALYVGTLLSELLSAENITLMGKAVKGLTPDSSLALVQHSSKPLSDLISYTNKESDNLYAELILKTIGAETRGAPGTAENGIAAIHQLFNEIGSDTTMFHLADGSGVSRYNVISPDQIIDLLKAMHHDFRVQAEFKASLPIAGVDGTLANRMKDTAAEGRLRAKTGSLRGVSALSGYTPTADGELLAFSMIMEHFVAPTSKIRAVQDQIGAALSAFSRSQMTSVRYAQEWIPHSDNK